MNRSIQSASFFLATTILLILTACQTTGKPPLAPIQEDSLSAETVFRHLQKQQAGFSDVKSFIRTTVEGKNGHHSFRQSLLLREPSALRLDTYGMLRQTLGVFIHAKNETLLYNVSKNQVIQGPQVWRLLADILGTQVDFKNNISVFGGNIPHLQTLQFLGGALNIENKVYQLIAFDETNNRKVEIEVDAETLLPSRIILTSPGKERITVKWLDYQKVGNRDFPHSWSWKFLTEKKKSP